MSENKSQTWGLVGAIWENEDGKLSMKVEQNIYANTRVYIFNNDRGKDNPKAPKYRMYVKLQDTLDKLKENNEMKDEDYASKIPF